MPYANASSKLALPAGYRSRHRGRLPEAGHSARAIAIKAFPNAARATTARLLVKFVRNYPQVHVDIVTEGRLMDLVKEGFELGARECALITSDVIT